MKKTIVLAAIVLAAFTAGIFAQATVSLFPNTQVTEEQRENAVWGVCYTSGYGVVDGVAVPGAWDDNAAMWSHYRVQLIKMLRRKYEVAKGSEANATLPAESTYDLGVAEE